MYWAMLTDHVEESYELAVSVQTTCTLDEPDGSVIRLQRKIFTSLILNPNSYNSLQGRVVYKLVDLLEISRVWVKTSK